MTASRTWRTMAATAATAAMAAMAAMAEWWRWRPFAVAVEGASMAPHLRPGEWLVAVRGRRPRRGDVVVVDHPERTSFEMVKYLTAVPGDTRGALRLGPDEFWVEGLRAEASTDSRWFGPVKGEAIRGVVAFRYWPIARIGPIRRTPEAT